jgi:Holliday junction resolvase-like predicted endonuclease
MTTDDYHGIVINHSQRDRSVFGELDVIGRKKLFLGLIVFYKIRVRPRDIDGVIKRLQENMSSRFLIKKQHYYAHFYRADELIVVFRDKTFRATTNKKTWRDAIAYGKWLHIVEDQLDFLPNRVEDETF